MWIRRYLLAFVTIGLSVAALSCSKPGSDSPRLLIVGLDGADWNIIDPLIAAGKMPNLGALKERGASGSLQSMHPIISPVIWTTIATGYGPDQHGVLDFTVPDPDSGEPIVITSRQRVAKAFWNLLDEQKKRVAVVGWWATWPAEAVTGAIVSDRMISHAFIHERAAREGLTSPPELMEELSKAFIQPTDVDLATANRFLSVTPEAYAAAPESDFNDPISHFRHIYAGMTNVGTVALDLLKREKPEVLAVYFEGTDTAGHMYMRHAPPPYPYSKPEEQAAYGRAVDEFFAYADEWLGRLLAEVGEETTVLIISDHGFLTGAQRPLESRANLSYRTAALWHRMDGIVAMAGPSIRAGVKLQGASVFDVLPNVLTVLDMPIAKDFRGKVWNTAFLEEPKPSLVDSYLDPAWAEERRSALQSELPTDPEMVEKLRSLGYLGGAESGSILSLRGRLGLAQYFVFVGERAKAVQELRSLIASAPDFYEAHYQLGLVALAAREADHAEESFRRTLQLEPGYVPAVNNLGAILRQSGRRDEAVTLLADAVRTHPNDMDLRINYAILLRESGRVPDAITELRSVTETFPGFTPARIQLAMMLHSAGEFEDAARAWQDVLQINPQDARAKGYLEDALAGRPFRTS